MRPLRIVVTGATGGLGRTACEMLLRRAWLGIEGFDQPCLGHGVQVVATGRRVELLSSLVSTWPTQIQVVQMDLVSASPSQLEALVKGADAVWHCAALSSPWGSEEQFFDANVLATRRLLQAVCAQHVPRFVHVSTPAIYFNFQHRLRVSERDALPEQFVNSYARTKHQAELAVQAAACGLAGGLSAAIIRPRALFGEHDQVLLPRLLRVAALGGAKLRLPGAGRTVLDLTYLDNAVDALWQATFAPLASPCEVFNVSNDEPVRLCDALAQLCKDLPVKQRFHVRSVPYPVASLAAHAQELVACFTGKEPALTRYSVGALAFDMTLDVHKARSVLGWHARVNMEQALKKTAAALAKKALPAETSRGAKR